MLNPEQLNVADSVIDAVTNNKNERANIFIIDGPGGTDKTFFTIT